MYIIVFSNRFKQDLRSLLKRNPQFKDRIRKKIEILASNPKYKSLRIHKLSGTENWSLSVNMSIRIIFKIKNDRILCTRIGKHEEVY